MFKSLFLKSNFNLMYYLCKICYLLFEVFTFDLTCFSFYLICFTLSSSIYIRFYVVFILIIQN